MNTQFESVITQFLRLVETDPHEKFIFYVDGNGNEKTTLTRQALYDRARSIALLLREKHHLKKGDRVVLVYPPGLEFVEALLACFFIGIIPVPVPPPMPLQPERGLPGYSAMVKDCQASAQLISQAYSRGRSLGRILQVLKNGSNWPDLPWIVTDTGHSSTQKDFLNESIFYPTQEETAFLQYTSGSTRAPRGVVISYGNLYAQTQLLKHELKTRPGDVGVFWMPHFHDFTLIGGIISALVGNYKSLILFSALDFLKRPALWAELIHRYRGTHTGSPDFGYKFLTSKTTPEQREKWDLSSLRVAMNAAETIRSKTVDTFLSAFQVARLHPDAFCPAYGLAEHTIAVSIHGTKRFVLKDSQMKVISTDELRQSKGKNIYFGCGRPARGVSVKIVDPETIKELSEGSLGEVWISSLSKAQGYFGRIEESKLKFEAKLENSDLLWLRTGDLGALAEGELIISGRVDDMLIYRGKNIYPHDIEEIISESSDQIRAGRVISFGVENDLVTLLELKEKKPDEIGMKSIAQSARVSILQELGIAHVTLVFVPHGTIPKTTSGKLQRQKCKMDWVNEKINYIYQDRGLGIL